MKKLITYIKNKLQPTENTISDENLLEKTLTKEENITSDDATTDIYEPTEVKPKNRYVNRELSWLQFNKRVLEEAEDPSVPLLERLRFLGIYSNNLDEFYKVRYATVVRSIQLNTTGYNNILENQSGEELLYKINEEVASQQIIYDNLYESLLKDLESENIVMVYDTDIKEQVHIDFVKDYYINKLSHAIIVLLLDDKQSFPELRDGRFYLAVKMTKDQVSRYAILEVPTYIFSRFVILPSIRFSSYVIYLEDIIRYNLDEIFRIFEYDTIEANSIKITRDAELTEDLDVQKSFVDKIAKSVEKRKKGAPVRMVYDRELASDTLTFLKEKLAFDDYDSLIPGSRYHNKKDFTNFPNLGRKDLEYKKIIPLIPPQLKGVKSYFQKLKEEDVLLYTPYHDFSVLLKFLREAAIDPSVKKIMISLYRVAKDSQIMSALINASRNGKEVIAVLELRARFDEEHNVKWSKTLQKEGVRLIFGITGLKVHSKMILIEREEQNKEELYAVVSTGNFHEGTAKLYTDYTLFTNKENITKEIKQVFDFILINYLIKPYQELLVSPLEARIKLIGLMDNEINNAKNGIPASIQMKMNSLSDKEFIDKLYEASKYGVKVKLIVRGICSLIPGVEGLSENIEAISVIDKFLEHPRLFWFGNAGNDRIFLSSSDIMSRNLDGRVEVSCPVQDLKLKQEIMDVFMLSFNDNVKGRIHNRSNKTKVNDKIKIRSQEEIYQYYLNKEKK